MDSKAKIPIAVFAFLACSLTVASDLASSQAKFDLQSLPRIKADRAHQLVWDAQQSLSYEVRSGKGFVLDTSNYRAEYAQAPENSLFMEHSKVITLDPVVPTCSAPESVDLVPGRDLYQVCPAEGLRSGDKFTVQIAEAFNDWGRHNSCTHWSAYVIVK